jgi:hypothetical protein
MKSAQITPKGMLLPKEWLQALGNEVTVTRSKGAILIEAASRSTARRKLTLAVKQMRSAAAGQSVTDAMLAKEVAAVRKLRARRH